MKIDQKTYDFFGKYQIDLPDMQQVQAHIGGVKIGLNYLTRAQKIAGKSKNDINPIQTLLNLIYGRHFDQQVD